MTALRRVAGAGDARALLLLVACVAASALFAVAAPSFGTAANLLTVARNSTELLLVSLGITLLLGMGSIDVSVGMVMGLAAVAVGHALLAGWPPLLAGLVGVSAGAVLGLVSALVVVGGDIPAIVGTLGLLGVYRATIFLALGGSWLSGLPTSLTEALSWRPIGIPVTIVVIAITYLIVWLGLRRTPFGLHLLAIGNAEERARLAGVSVRRTRVVTFVLSGVLCGLAAVFYVATYRNVATTVGGTLALDAIAAVVLGGTSVTGGRCSLLGTAIGVVLLRVVQNGLLLVGVPSLWQAVVTGALLLGVLATEAMQGRLASNLTMAGPRA